MWNNNSLTNHYWICAWKNSNLPEFHNFIKFHHQTARQISFKMHQCLLHLPDTFIGYYTRTMYTQWRNKSKISEKLSRCGGQNMLWLYLKIWEWEWIFGRAVKAIFTLDVRSPWYYSSTMYILHEYFVLQCL